MQVHLRSVNLNLLPILGALLATRSVTAAAAKLHMSQSAVSDALARLRLQFRDELLVRSGRTMRLTPLARDLAQPLHEILARIEDVVESRAVAPAELEREFVVATADPVVFALGAGVYRLLREQAPRASVRFVDVGDRDPERLHALEVDLIIVPRGLLRPEKLIEAPLYDEGFVCITRRNHPAITHKLTRRIYEKLPHVSFRADPRSRVSMESRLLGIEHGDVVKVASFALLPIIVEQTDAVAFVQRRVAEKFAESADIELHQTPIPVPPQTVCLYWAQAQARDPAHEWFRQRLQELGAGL